MARCARREAARGLAAACLALALLAAPAPLWAVEPDGIAAGETVSPTGEAQAPALPAVLDPADIERYRDIFDLQERGRWRDADRAIANLDDRLLLGHVLAQRYLHPTRYRSHFRELRDWLAHYADHPQAKRIYKLALKRRPGSAPYPRRPAAQPFPVYDNDVGGGQRYRSPRYRSRAQMRAASRDMWRIKRFSGRDRFTYAQRYLESPRVRALLDPVERDISYARIGAGWFRYGDARKAYDLASPAAARSGRHFPDGFWYAGLAAFQLGRYVEAADYFEAMSRSTWLTSWEKSAAAFWAARSNLVGRRPERVHRLLAKAAAQPRTFYGLLASRLLGRDIVFEWDLPELTPDLASKMLRRRSGRRALALIQTGRDEQAERELRFMAIGRDPGLAPALLAVADRAGLPAVALRAATHFSDDDGGPAYGALYPVPDWEPPGGYLIDRALVFAFMRQESGFNTRAKSHAGARGLMQLMPATAGYMARKRFRGHRRNQLYDPEYNIALGQKYLHYLITHEVVQGDLLMLTAAYNGGPGNLSKWRRRAERSDYTDPLLFIESIPSAETRNFVERVLANLWIYRARLGQPAVSLDLLAAGERPIYESLDGRTRRLALDVRDRR